LACAGPPGLMWASKIVIDVLIVGYAWKSKLKASISQIDSREFLCVAKCRN